MIELEVMSAAAVGWPAEGEPPSVRALLKRVCAKAPRRLNRFTELALLGACQCAQGRALRPDCAVWLASGRGYAADTTALVEAVTLRREPPMPVEFINVSGNTAGFYIAQLLGLNGRSGSVAAGAASFEAGLALATAGLTVHGGQALVGGVDERPPADGAAPPGEGSSWLLLQAAGRGGLARLRLHRPVDDPRAVLAAADADWLSLGASIDAEQRRALLAGWRGQALDADALCGRYPSNAAYALAWFIERRPGQRLLHLSADRHGRYRPIELEPL
mgnify:FL=1